MTQRVIVCSLDPNMERPELRKFEAKPVDMVLSDRGKYIAAALTICRAYAIAGYPDQCRPLAPFEDWSRVVRSALVWLGREDPVATMEAARADDPVSSLLRTLFTSWFDATGPAWMSAAELKREAETTNAFGGTIARISTRR
jgi:putative DNA primase/helicase